MPKYQVILKSLKVEGECIVLSVEATKINAELMRKNWRQALGGKHWMVDRRPGLDTLDHLALLIEEVK